MKSKILIVLVITVLLIAGCESQSEEWDYSDGPPVFDSIYIDEVLVLQVDERGNVDVTMPIDVGILVDRYCVHQDTTFDDLYRPLLLAVLRENVAGFAERFDQECTEFKFKYELE